VSLSYTIQDVPGRKVNYEVIVSAIPSKKCICTCVLFRTVSEIEQQHAISSQECIDVDGGILENIFY
jgi:hypothetical protein